MKYLEIINEVERELPGTVSTWRDFFPGLNPEDWQITESEHGVYGRKVKGEVAGTVAFYLPVGRLAAGPSAQQRAGYRLAVSCDDDRSRYLDDRTGGYGKGSSLVRPQQ